MQRLGQTLERAAWAVRFLIQLIVVGILVGSVVLIVTNSIGRYFLDSPIRWQEEILRYALLWLVFLGAVLVTFDGKHLKMDLISSALKGPARLLVNGLAVAVFIFVCGFIAWHSLDWVNLFLETGQTSQIADVPMVIPHIIIPICLALMVIGILVRLGGHVRGDIEADLDDVPAAGDPMHAAEENGGDLPDGGAIDPAPRGPGASNGDRRA